MRMLLCWALVIALSDAKATTWADETVEDPVAAGEKCDVQVPASSGSYIYSWESKYDQVFWPLTDHAGLWFCQKSGFIAFIGDFDKISASERSAIQDHLQKHYSGSASIQQKLKLLEELYALRKKDDKFRNMLLRVLARWYQDLEDYERANSYRAQALEEILVALKTPLPDQVRLEYVYVACNYEVFLGRRTASECIPEVEKALAETKDEKLSDYVSYLRELLEETPRIKPGKKLDPPPEVGA